MMGGRLRGGAPFGQVCVINRPKDGLDGIELRRGRGQGEQAQAAGFENGQGVAHHPAVPPQRLLIDCSHASSGKDHRRQPLVFGDVLDQRAGGDDRIVGCLLESHLFEGNQPLTEDPSLLRYGVFSTDACLRWETTEALLTEAARRLRRLREAGSAVV